MGPMAKSNTEEEEKDINTTNDDVDVDCLLLSSPLKSQAQLMLNPLYSSNTGSEDSSSSSDIVSTGSEANIMNNVSDNSSSETSSISELPTVQEKMIYEEKHRDTDEDGGPDDVSDSGGGSDDVSEENDDITVLEITSLGIENDESQSNNSSDIKKDKTDIFMGKSDINVEEPSLTTLEDEDKLKSLDIKPKFERSKTEHKTNSLDNSIIIVNLDDDDEVDNVETIKLVKKDNNVKEEEKKDTIAAKSEKIEKKEDLARAVYKKE